MNPPVLNGLSTWTLVTVLQKLDVWTLKLGGRPKDINLIKGDTNLKFYIRLMGSTRAKPDYLLNNCV